MLEKFAYGSCLSIYIPEESLQAVLAVAILCVIVRRAMYPTSEQLHLEAMLSGGTASDLHPRAEDGNIMLH